MAIERQRDPTSPSGANLLVLLLVRTFSLMITPLFEAWALGRQLIYLGTTAVLVAAAAASRRRHGVFAICLAVAALAIPITWSTLLWDHALLFVLSCVLESVFYAGIACLLLVSVLKRHLATIQSVFGVVCVYLLLGLAWAQLYWATERMDHESLSLPARGTARQVAGERSEVARRLLPSVAGRRPDIAAYSQMVYFSFVTMSTLGYGDIVPETPAARTLAWMQSVLGQFYLAVLVGWVVSEIPRPPRRAGASERSSGQA